MSQTTEAELRLVVQIDRLTGEFSKMAQLLGELTANVSHLASSQEEAKTFGDRITVLETRADMSEKYLAGQRWLIGMLLTVVSLVLAVVLHYHH